MQELCESKMIDSVLTLDASRKEAMWKDIAVELCIPWRACEDMHWQIGQDEMANLAGVTTLHGKRSAVNERSSGHRNPSGLPPSSGQPNMQTRFVSTPTSTFSRLPAQPRAMLAQPSAPATTSGTAPPHIRPGYEETGFGFDGTSSRPSSSRDVLPSLAEMDSAIRTCAVHGQYYYREDEEEVEEEEEEEEEEEAEEVANEGETEEGVGKRPR
ncbi:MAG: hypothetical protein Q9200_004824 [Gallowayella weberi]